MSEAPASNPQTQVAVRFAEADGLSRARHSSLLCMTSTLLNLALAGAILGGAWALTHLFARAMYIVCPACRTLNARRRKHCRKCGEVIRPPQDR